MDAAILNKTPRLNRLDTTSTGENEIYMLAYIDPYSSTYSANFEDSEGQTFWDTLYMLDKTDVKLCDRDVLINLYLFLKAMKYNVTKNDSVNHICETLIAGTPRTMAVRCRVLWVVILGRRSWR
jgi:hypothetical protein